MDHTTLCFQISPDQLKTLTTTGRFTRKLQHIAVLCALCVLASLSGCLTAGKILTWEQALHRWATAKDASRECKQASALASKYLVDANRTLTEARSAFDLESDAQAKQLINTAAQACGKQ